ncbi:MAG TPA: ATP-binding protein, partial [Candidatus Obscuribacterales bacterium]
WIMRRKETELTGLRDHFAEQLEKRTRELATANDNLLLEVERRKQVEERLKKAVKELSTSNDKLNQFAKIASHDLQEPLRVIEGYSDLLTRRYKGQLDVRGDDFIQQMVDATKRMQVLIQDILLHSQIQARSQPFQTTDLNQVLGEALLNLHKTVTESGAQITFDALPTLPADRLQLVQLFQNLIANAIKFHGPEQPKIHVSASFKGTEWILSVSDNGIGIDPCYFERSFQMFTRLHSRVDYPGTGVGLAICKTVVEQHGGKIWVESKPHTGATFCFTLPTMQSQSAGETSS